MQAVSDGYIKAMKAPFRNNRSYIRGTIGIINSDAQDNATVDNGKNAFAYFSNTKKPFEDETVTRIYATCEQNFSKLDGSRYFLPKKDSKAKLYNNGIVTYALLGKIYISFGDVPALDIKGLTIDFGDCFPTKLTIENENAKYTYENDKRVFITEDVFDGTSRIIITPIAMVNGQGRLRIYKINFGIVVSFGNAKTKSCSISEYVSPTAETLPSKDVEIILDNNDSYYNVEKEESAIRYLELGQEVKIAFGYDVHGDGNIEWLPEMLTYLKNWSANDTEAQFICADLFTEMNGVYYKGLYRKNGISLYDLALDVFSDAGIKTERYYIDTYLKDIIVYNPMPPVKHSEALQIIANAGRCALYDDRDGRIHLQASFRPDMSVASNGETAYSKVENILNDSKKDAYAVASNDFSKLDGTLKFMPKNGKYLNTGYVSSTLSDSEGNFAINPRLTVTLEAGFVAYGFKINFRNVKPEEFIITTYNDNVLVERLTVRPTSGNYDTQRRFEMFDKLVVEFTKGYPNSRIFVDELKVGDVTNYHISRSYDMYGYPTATLTDKLKTMCVFRSIYNESKEVIELAAENVSVSPERTTHTVYFGDPAYQLSASIEDNTIIKATIVESSNYYAKVRFSGVTSSATVRVIITGKEYAMKENRYIVQHDVNGIEMEWENPLISTEKHAQDLEEWLSSYYLGRTEYEFNWRGDPRTDANDLFYIELKDGRERMIRAYENNLTFNGAWRGSIKSRAVMV